LQPAPYRNYPEGSIAAQVLGFVGLDAHGLAGLELSFDDELHGETGRLVSARDTSGQEITIARRAFAPARDGADLVLTIDRFLQRLAERELATAVQQNKAIGGQILIMEPATGAILAAASLPNYSLLDEIRTDQQALMKPTIVTNQYEPGSVMKVVTVAAGVDTGALTPDTLVDDPGSVLVDGVRISNWDHGGHGTINMRQVLIYSSNVGSTAAAFRLGPDNFYRYLSTFGFGAVTDVGLPGEVAGSFRTPEDRAWRRIDLATNSFGQGVAVTPLQMLSSVAALANDGILMQPMLVKEVRRGDDVTLVAPKDVRRVVSSRTAQQMVDMMISVMQQPALEQHRIPGYTIAGKTGTADFPSTDGYLKDRTYASHIGFGPAHAPRWAMLVRLDAPEGIYGGAVAVPVFKRLAEELFTYLRIPPSSSNGPAATRVTAAR
jgi:cell division protein FtsI/penicillin-binding protein 2